MTKGRQGPAKPSAFGAVYETISTPADLGYDPPIKVIIRANPSKAQWQRWNDASAEATKKPAELDQDATDAAREQYDRDLAAYQEAKREQEIAICASLSELFDRTVEATPDLDFSTVESVLALWDNDDLPDELWIWILALPWQVVGRRRAAITGN